MSREKETKSEQPSVEEQRAILEQARGELRRKGFVYELEIVSQKAQSHPDARAKAKALAELRVDADNCYAGAREMSKLIEALPPAKAKGVK